MIIPIKCFTCGTVLADKYRYYLKEVVQKKMANDQKSERVVYLTKDNFDKTAEGEALDQLKLYRMCCRRHMLTHVDLE